MNAEVNESSENHRVPEMHRGKGGTVSPSHASEPLPATSHAQGARLGRLRTLNTLTISSLGSLFSSSASAFAGRDSIDQDARSDSSTTAETGHAASALPAGLDDDLTPSAHASSRYSLRAEDYCAAKTLGCGVVSGAPPPAAGAAAHGRWAAGAGQAHISGTGRFSEVRRLFGGLSRSRRVLDMQDNARPPASPAMGYGAVSSRSLTSPGAAAEPTPSQRTFDSRTNPRAPASPAMDCRNASALALPAAISEPATSFVGSMPSMSMCYSEAAALETPPLTPDSFNDYMLPSPGLSLDSFDASLGLDDFCAAAGGGIYAVTSAVVDGREGSYDDGSVYTGVRLREVKEGKRADRGDVHDALTREAAVVDDEDEWYGMEYTLEVSARERRLSDVPAGAGGEHSKSRESWAALHRGRMHPFFEHEDYLQWKSWHRFLDRQGERRRHRRGMEFASRAGELAWWFVCEMRTREVLYDQMEMYGAVSRDVKERLQYIVECRPDPFFPRRKHNFAWYLRRSRSVGSIRELKPVHIGQGANAKEE